MPRHSRSRLGRFAFWRQLMFPGRRGLPRRPQGPDGRRFALGRAPGPTEVGTGWRQTTRWLAMGAGIAAVAYLALWIVQSDTFRVGHIAIEGIEVTSPQAILAAAQLDGDLMFTLDGSGAANRIEALESVKSVTVSRHWPGTVRIDVVEHQAWGYWQNGGERVPVDREGHALVAARPAPADAPTIIEFAAPRDREGGIRPDVDAVQLAARLIEDPTFVQRGITPVAFVFEQDRGLTVAFDNAPSVVFGDSSSYAYKLAAWIEVHDEIATRELVVAEIDLRFGRQVVLR